MKSYDLRASTDAMTEFDGPGGEFVLAVELEERCAIIQKQKLEIAKLRDALDDTYTDDVVAVMRDTIAAQREKIAALEKELEPLRLGRTFWNAVDEGHPAVELLKRFAAWYESEGLDGDLVRLGRDVKTYLAKLGEAA